MKKYLLIGLIVLSLLFVVGCSVEDDSFNNPYSGTCPQGKDSADCPGECGQFIDTNEDGLCDRSQP
jgi:hypothetical protein